MFTGLGIDFDYVVFDIREIPINFIGEFNITI